MLGKGQLGARREATGSWERPGLARHGCGEDVWGLGACLPASLSRFCENRECDGAISPASVDLVGP